MYVLICKQCWEVGIIGSSQSTDEETEALNTQYLICTPTTDKTCYKLNIFRNGPTMICTPLPFKPILFMDLSA